MKNKTPYIIGGIIILAVIFYFVFRKKPTATSTLTGTTTSTSNSGRFTKILATQDMSSSRALKKCGSCGGSNIYAVAQGDCSNWKSAC